MTVRTGSYAYDTLEKGVQIQEFERLQHQATMLLETERELWPSLNIVPGKSVLDIGCGAGIVTHELAAQVYPSQVTGVDVSHDLLEQGKLTCNWAEQTGNSKAIEFKEGTAYDLPFPSEQFDVVYARLLFQHLSEPDKALQNILRVLKPDGLLCIVDIDKDWSSLYPEPETSVNLDQAIVEKQLLQGGDPWVGRKLGSYLKSAGFKRVRTNISLIDSDRLGLSNFFEMLSLGRSYQTGDNEFTTMRSEIRPAMQKLVENPYAWAGFGLFVVTGRKEAIA